MEKTDLSEAEKDLNLNEENSKEDSKEENNKKLSLVKKVLIVSIAFLSIILIVLFIIVLSQESSEEETPKVETDKKVEQEANQTKNENIDEVENKFDFNNLDPDKLNEQLALLTNKNMQIQKEEEFKATNEVVEKEALPPIEEKLPTQTYTENKKDSDEKSSEQKISDKIIEDNFKEEDKTLSDDNIEEENNLVEDEETPNLNEEIVQEDKDNIIIKLINIAKIKGELTKKYLDKVLLIDNNVLLCRDDKNKIELYFGPFKDDEERQELLNSLLKNGFEQAHKVELSKKEFDKRCNY